MRSVRNQVWSKIRDKVEDRLVSDNLYEKYHLIQVGVLSQVHIQVWDQVFYSIYNQIWNRGHA